MAQQNTTIERVPTCRPDSSSAGSVPERLAADLSVTADYLSIFSAPALEVVFQWWHESNRRWSERSASGAGARL